MPTANDVPPTATILQMLAPILILLAGIVLLWLSSQRWLRPDPAISPGRRQLRLIAFFLGAAFWLVLFLIAILFATNQTDRDLLLWLVGGAISVIITLASTSFVSNTLAGVALQIMAHFRLGDYIEVGPQFGRVQERGLLHIRIENDDGDLTTLPNLFILSQPVTVVPESGTIVSATLSLGYDIPHNEIQQKLLAAVTATGLTDPFVLILDLGDFSVTYRFGGKLAPVQKLLTIRSRLRESALDALHGAEIEIVSPTFMNQRALDPTRKVIPRGTVHRDMEPEIAADDVIFEQSEKAQEQEKLRAELAKLVEQLADLHKTVRGTQGEVKERQDGEIAQIEERIETIRTSLNQEKTSSSSQ